MLGLLLIKTTIIADSKMRFPFAFIFYPGQICIGIWNTPAGMLVSLVSTKFNVDSWAYVLCLNICVMQESVVLSIRYERLRYHTFHIAMLS